MRNDNYPSASEMVRNLAQIRLTWELLHSEGNLRVIKFERHFDGYVFWVVNEKGFLWEPVDNLEAGMKYLESEEAKEYNAA